LIQSIATLPPQLLAMQEQGLRSTSLLSPLRFSIVTSQKYYLRSSDENEKKVVGMLEEMGVEAPDQLGK
jgi:hypothetical protein